MDEQLSASICLRLQIAGYPQSEKGPGWEWDTTISSCGWVYQSGIGDFFGMNKEDCWVSAPTKKTLNGLINFDCKSKSIEVISIGIAKLNKESDTNPHFENYEATIKMRIKKMELDQSHKGNSEIHALALLWLALINFDYSDTIKKYGKTIRDYQI